MDARERIKEIVDRETRAWDTQDLTLLMSIFHPDMVWPWPANNMAHDPALWVLELGRFDHVRWRQGWADLFATHTLVHNRRNIVRIEVSAEQDAGFAVVDVDTLWRAHTGADFHWLGRACKVYTTLDGEWKLISHHGLLRYDHA